MRRRAFTLIEIVTYLALISTSIVLLATFQINTHSAVAEQSQAFEVASQADRLFQFLRADLRVARAIELSEGGATLTVTLHSGARTTYQRTTTTNRHGEASLERRELDPQGTLVLTESWPLVVEHGFAREGSLLKVEVQAVRRRSAQERQLLPFRWQFLPLSLER